MGLIKLAKKRDLKNSNIQNLYQVSTGAGSPSLTKKDAIALLTGTTATFAGKEAIEAFYEKRNALKKNPLNKKILKDMEKLTLPQKYVSRLGSVALGTIGTIGTYKLLNKSKSKNE